MTTEARTIIGAIAEEPYVKWLGMRVLPAEGGDGGARVELPYKEENSNPGRQVHGGVVASAMVAAARAAALCALPIEGPRAAGMVSMHVGYLASAVGEAIGAEARVLRRGKELCYVRSDAANSEGKPLGTATAVYRVAPGLDPAPYPYRADRSADHDGAVGQLGRALTAAPFIDGVGMVAEQMKDGIARIRLKFRASNANGAGATDDGVVAALLDTCGALSAWSLVTPRRGVRASTVGVDINYVGAAPGIDLIARSRTLGRRREIFFNRVEIEGSDGALAAWGAVVYRIVLPDQEER